jgi:hypothetical protein
MPNWDGSTRGPKHKDAPHHAQTTHHVQTRFPEKAKNEEKLYPHKVETTFSQGDKAVSQFPVKY